MKHGIGIDWGIKNMITTSDNFYFKNILFDKKYLDLRKQYELIKLNHSFNDENRKPLLRSKLGEIKKIEMGYFSKVANSIINAKPDYIAIEDLDMKFIYDKHRYSHFRSFRSILKKKCINNNIELRQVNRFYASSKICSNCNHIKTNLKLSDRTYTCDNCGVSIDRDLNASINIKNCKDYKILVCKT